MIPDSGRAARRPYPGAVPARHRRTTGREPRVLSFPMPRPVPRRAHHRQTGTGDPSQLDHGTEQPDPGADPHPLGSVRAVDNGAGSDESAGEDTTADVGENQRTKGVLDLERPADGGADDPTGW